MDIFEFSKFESIYNLSRITSFHNDLRSCMRDALAKTDDPDSIETKLWKSRWQYYDTLLHANTFLMVCAHTEEWLASLSKEYYPDISIKEKRGIFSKYKPVLRDGFRIDLSGKEWKGWSLLTDCEEIRNCLLHANGRVDLMKKEKEAEIRRAAKCRSVDIDEGNRLRIPSNFLKSFAENIDYFITGLLDRLKKQP